MKQTNAIVIICLSLFSGFSSYGKTLQSVSEDTERLNLIADYLTSMDQSSRTRLASKLYYLDPMVGKQEAQSSLFNELSKSGRVLNEKGISTAPRTDF
jgi:hypothetical protein